MADFEFRTKHVTESEDKFMLALLKRFQSANPMILDVADKSKFFQVNVFHPL